MRLMHLLFPFLLHAVIHSTEAQTQQPNSPDLWEAGLSNYETENSVIDEDEKEKESSNLPFQGEHVELDYEDQHASSNAHGRANAAEKSERGKRVSKQSTLDNFGSAKTARKQYNCPICAKVFHRLWNLIVHRRIHTGEKPFNCSVCGESFRYTSALNAHRTIHTGEILYNCSLCGASFNYLSNLRTHQKIHTGEKPHGCSECERRFGRSSTLVSHMRTHTGERPFKCPLCAKCFSQSSMLNRHIRSHTGERPYICSICSRCFSQLSHLKRHAQRVHGS